MKKIKLFFDNNIILKNSLYLILSNGFLSAGGFLFWIITARMYSTYDIGIATSLIGLVNLLSSLALLGLNTGILRYLPISVNRNSLVNSTLFLVSVASIGFSLFVVFNMNYLSPPLSFIEQNLAYLSLFTIFTVFASLNHILESIFIAIRGSKYIFIKNIIQGIVKLILPFFLIYWGAFGIFGSFYISTMVAVIYAMIYLTISSGIVYKLHFSLPEMKKIYRLSTGTYIASLTSTMPIYILPVLITNTLGAEQTAFYYIAATTANVLYLIPQVISQNLLVEGSYDTSQLSSHFRKSVYYMLAIVIPCVLLILLFGNIILSVFGKNYLSEGLNLLKILSIGGVIVGFNSLFVSLLTVFHYIKSLIIINLASTVCLFVATYYLTNLGIEGVGYSTLFSQAILLILTLMVLINGKKGYLLKSIFS